MKITKVEVRNMWIPMKIPYALQKAYGTKTHTSCIIVKLHTDEGIWGLGECNPQPGFTEESAESVKCIIGKLLAPAIIGMDPTDVGAIVKKMDLVCKGNNLPKAAIDTACYDICGKAANMPVHKLLGGKLMDKIPIMHAIGNSDPETSAKLVLQRKQEGYTAVMIKCGAFDIGYDAERVQAVRAAVGKDFPLIVDVNQGWDYHQSLQFLRMTENCGLTLLEQPVPCWDIDSLARLKNATDVPISADESVFTTQDAMRLIEKKAVDIFSIKINKHGGIYKAKEIVTLAKHAGIKCLMNSMLEEGIVEAASLQVGCTADNLVSFGHAYFSPLRLDDDITTYSQQIKDGWVHVSDKPGLGIELLEEKVQRYLLDEFVITEEAAV